MPSTSASILLSRLATKSGDHAWELALPLVLAKSFNGSIGLVALVYMITRLVQILTMSYVGRWMDRNERFPVFSRAIAVQLSSVLIVTVLTIYFLVYKDFRELSLSAPIQGLLFWLLAVAASASSVGAAVCHNAIFSDWVPCLFAGEQRRLINGRLKQIDLGCEIVAPIIAGILLSPLLFGDDGLIGFLIVAGWNLFSFLLEYRMLRRTSIENAVALMRPHITTSPGLPETALHGWRKFFSHPVALTVCAYSLMWLTVLTPHGAILTAYLEADGELDEGLIGIFRAVGALCGIMPTFFVPALIARIPVRKVALGFISFQTLCCLIGALVVTSNGADLLFLAMVVLSRIGVYGYSLCEIQLRQDLVEESIRGEISGKFTALANICALAITGMAIVWGSAEEFWKLAWVSTAAIALGVVCVAASRRLPDRSN